MVGSAIERTLLSKGYKNLLLINKNNLDLTDFNSVQKWFKKNKPDIVILAAAKVGGIKANNKYSADFILENLKIQTNVIENAFNFKTKRFLFLGSSCIYPKFASQPLREEYLLTGPLEMTNEAYAIAKIAGIKLCSNLKKQYGFDSISVMPTNLYGKGDNYHESNSHVLPSLIRKFYEAKIKNLAEVICWGTGMPKREFLFVDDLAEACIFVLENISSNDEILFDEKSNFNGIINIGVGNDLTIKELAKLISKEVGYKGKINWDNSKPDGTPRKLLDISKLKQKGWQAETSLECGIRITLKDFITNYENKILRC